MNFDDIQINDSSLYPSAEWILYSDLEDFIKLDCVADKVRLSIDDCNSIHIDIMFGSFNTCSEVMAFLINRIDLLLLCKAPVILDHAPDDLLNVGILLTRSNGPELIAKIVEIAEKRILLRGISYYYIKNLMHTSVFHIQNTMDSDDLCQILTEASDLIQERNLQYHNSCILFQGQTTSYPVNLPLFGTLKQIKPITIARKLQRLPLFWTDAGVRADWNYEL